MSVANEPCLGAQGKLGKFAATTRGGKKKARHPLGACRAVRRIAGATRLGERCTLSGGRNLLAFRRAGTTNVHNRVTVNAPVKVWNLLSNKRCLLD
jgi:hypothetical protein